MEEGMTWIAYMLNPIDFGWQYLPTVQEAGAKISGGEIGEALADMPGSSGVSFAAFVSALETALALARTKGWEGDFRPGHLWF